MQVILKMSIFRFADPTIQMRKKEYGAEGRYSSEPQKAHLTGEFVTVAKFGGHTLRHLTHLGLRM